MKWGLGRNKHCPKLLQASLLSHTHYTAAHSYHSLYMNQASGVRVMVFNATFNNISVISWQSALLVEETRVPGENHRPVASHWQTWSHNFASSTPSPWTGFELTTLVVIGADCTCSSKYNTFIRSWSRRLVSGDYYLYTRWIKLTNYL